MQYTGVLAYVLLHPRLSTDVHIMVVWQFVAPNAARSDDILVTIFAVNASLYFTFPSTSGVNLLDFWI